MRNIFDQYTQPENRITHALYCTLSRDRSLLQPFLEWIGVENIPKNRELKLVQQSLPGTPLRQSEGNEGLPDLSIYCDETDESNAWGVFFEMKVQSNLTTKQLERHKATAIRYGFPIPVLVALTVEDIANKFASEFLYVTWRDVYQWFSNRESSSSWAHEFVRYMEIFEEKSIDGQYEIKGTITMFNGLRFDDGRPYNHLEAKRLVRLLGDALQKREDLETAVGIDPNGSRRPAITHDDMMWDYIPLKEGAGVAFNTLPHFTMSIQPSWPVAALTIPNSVSGGFRKRLKAVGKQGFIAILAGICSNLSGMLETSPRSQSCIYATQRHFKSQKSIPEIDGRIVADLRTIVPANGSNVKYQPQWIEAIYDVLLKKNSNIQCGLEVRFDYACPKVRSPEVIDLFAESWKSMAPLLDLALNSDSK